VPSCTADRDWSIGSHAFASTSQNKNINTPTAVALSTTRRPGAGRRIRPIGRPMMIVTPAMNPSSSVVDRLTGTPQCDEMDRVQPYLTSMGTQVFG
jgi:hypothetical protein